MALKSLSTRALRLELARRESGAGKLAKKHAKLAKQLAALEAQLSDLGGSPAALPRAKAGRGPGRPKGSRNKKKGKVGRPKGSGRKPGRPAKAKGGKGRKRAKNEMTLPEAILKNVGVGATVSPADAAVAAKKAGYKSSSPNFGMMVANALAKDGRFKRLERGQYQRVK